VQRYAATVPKPITGLSCVDIFSGAGGLAEGFRQGGFDIISGSDIDPHASQTFRRNFPEASYFEGDIAALKGAHILDAAGVCHIDCLIGGPPCQAFSYNSHLRSHRSAIAGLFREYLRLVRELNPQFLVMENVPGILSVGNGGVVGEIASYLGSLGYETDGRILYAEDFGVPQQRRRMIFIASRVGMPTSIFPDGTHGPAPKPLQNEYVHRWEHSPNEAGRRLVRVWSAIGDLPAQPVNVDMTKAIGYRTGAWCDFQRYAREGSPGVANHHTVHLGDTMMTRIRHVPQGGSWRNIPRHLLPAGMKRAKTSCHTKRYGRLAPNDLACTVLTKCDPHWGCYIHPNEDRVLTVREAARLQSFPDRFQFYGPQLSQYRLVGNSVPPLLARAIAKSLLAYNASSLALGHSEAETG
jgi:DNA (cytosine-5)-methyltransferase 1